MDAFLGESRRTAFISFKATKCMWSAAAESSTHWTVRRRRRAGIFQVFCLWSKESKINFDDADDFPVQNVILKLFQGTDFSGDVQLFHDKTQFFSASAFALSSHDNEFSFPRTGFEAALRVHNSFFGILVVLSRFSVHTSFVLANLVTQLTLKMCRKFWIGLIRNYFVLSTNVECPKYFLLARFFFKVLLLTFFALNLILLFLLSDTAQVN